MRPRRAPTTRVIPAAADEVSALTATHAQSTYPPPNSTTCASNGWLGFTMFPDDLVNSAVLV
ncbi:PE family protein [Mycobacterium marinum]|uniref:PE family protein n=1 Tax=Mycobacterium marinum TaxID=1781 RepID=UPI001FB746A0|nr:PE family protein [Mycobacterium marinum]